MRIRARREFRLKALVRLAIVEPRDANQLLGFRLSGRGVPCFQYRALEPYFFQLRAFQLRFFQLLQHARQIPVRRRPRHQRNIRRPLENLLALLLRHTSQHAKLLALLLIFLVIVEPVKNLLLRLVADRAGVVQNQVSLFDRIHLPIPLRHQRANDLFGVVDIHLAAESFEVKRL